jgi:hypothetical protein
MSGSLARLQGAGLVPAEVEEAYSPILDGLSEAEVDVLISVGARLIAASDAAEDGDDAGGFGLTPGSTGLPVGGISPTMLPAKDLGMTRPVLGRMSPIANNDGLIFH